MGQPQVQPGQGRFLGAVPVPPGKDGKFPRRRPQGLLLLLRLPRQGRCRQLPARGREHGLHGGDRGSGARCGDADARARSPSCAKGRPSQPVGRGDGSRCPALPDTASHHRGGRGARLPEPPQAVGSRSRPVRDRLCPRRLAGALGSPQGQGHRRRPDPGRRPCQTLDQGQGALRRFPQPDHVPDPRRARPLHRLRRPGDGPGRQRQVPEFAGNRAFRQGPQPLQPRPRARSGGQGRTVDRRRGLHGRDRAGDGGVPRRRRAPWHGDHRRPASPSLAHPPRTAGHAGRRHRGHPGRHAPCGPCAADARGRLRPAFRDPARGHGPRRPDPRARTAGDARPA